MQRAQTAPWVAIACGGTGGHLFPGLAVAEALAQSGCAVSLLISPKEVDQQAVASAVGVQVVTLPAVGLVNGQIGAFLRGFWQSYRATKQKFRTRAPQAVLAMGSFTSAPPILAGRKLGASTFLHESNSIPGRANRWLAPWVDAVFVGDPAAAVSRAGASSLAELAAMRVPAVLIPYPEAANNHQFYNAWALVESGAARMLEQEKATPEMLVGMLRGLIGKPEQSAAMKAALAKWHQPHAAARIAARILEALARTGVPVAPLANPEDPSAH